MHCYTYLAGSGLAAVLLTPACNMLARLSRSAWDQVHAWLLFNEGAACSALCAALAEGGTHGTTAERALSGTLESLLRVRATTGRADIRTGCGALLNQILTACMKRFM